ncbi:MAG: Fic family protein [Bifidobacterium sp.]|nr:Fic family protein [Bifidobacterium sp.]
MDEVRVRPVEYAGAREWRIEPDERFSNSYRAMREGTYQPSVPARIADLTLDLPDHLKGLVDEAADAVREFSDYACAKLTGKVATRGPIDAAWLYVQSAAAYHIPYDIFGTVSPFLIVDKHRDYRYIRQDLVVAGRPELQDLWKPGATIDERGLQTLHGALMARESGWAAVSSYRRGQAWVGHDKFSPVHGVLYVAPEADLVAGYARDLCAFIDRDDLPPVAQAAVMAAQYEAVLPFAEGNGRTVNGLLQTMLLMKGVARTYVPPVATGLIVDYDRYFSALASYRDGDAGPIIALFAEACTVTARQGLHLVDELERSADSLAGLLAKRRRNAGFRRVQEHLFLQPIMDSRYLDSVIKVDIRNRLHALKPYEDLKLLVRMDSDTNGKSLLWVYKPSIYILNRYLEGIEQAVKAK